MIAALELLAGLPGRHVAVLGEMRELGAEHEAGHRTAGAAAGRTLSLLVVVDGQVGGAAAPLAEAARAAGLPADEVVVVPDAAAAVEALTGRLVAGDVVLVKASRGVELERAVEGLVASLGGPEGGA
jgi:UDP-N-acetylmuramoyl-tripeptide--D-alanyl-D-alanine ligase